MRDIVPAPPAVVRNEAQTIQELFGQTPRVFRNTELTYNNDVAKVVEDMGFDAILTLPAFGEAPEGLSFTGNAEFCAPWTLLGVPALTLPAGFGKRGLPLGLQIVGAYRQDERMLRAAKWIESLLNFDPGIPCP